MFCSSLLHLPEVLGESLWSLAYSAALSQVGAVGSVKSFWFLHLETGIWSYWTIKTIHTEEIVMQDNKVNQPNSDLVKAPSNSLVLGYLVLIAYC